MVTLTWYKYNANCRYFAFYIAFIYPIVVHWAWDPKGWLLYGVGQVHYAVYFQDTVDNNTIILISFLSVSLMIHPALYALILLLVTSFNRRW